MSLELSDEDVRAIRDRTLERMAGSLTEYARIRGAIAEKWPEVTNDAIEAAQVRLRSGTARDDGQAATHVALVRAASARAPRAP